MTEYENHAGFAKEIKNIVDNPKYPELESIREQELVILSLLVIRTSTKGEPIEGKRPVVCRKLPPEIKTLTGGHYLILGDHYFWTHQDEIKKEAALFSALMTIDISINKYGSLVLKRRNPDIVEHTATLRHFGAYQPHLIDLRDALKSAAKQFAENQQAKPT
jgi:hypothetical protein